MAVPQWRAQFGNSGASSNKLHTPSCMMLLHKMECVVCALLFSFVVAPFFPLAVLSRCVTNGKPRKIAYTPRKKKHV